MIKKATLHMQRLVPGEDYFDVNVVSYWKYSHDANSNGIVSLESFTSVQRIGRRNQSIQIASCNSTKASRERKAKCSNSIDSSRYWFDV